MQGHYSPGMLPGDASRDRPDIARPGSATRSGSLAVIESRLYAIRRNSQIVNLDPALKAFLETDVPHLMNIARAADRWAYATNAEISRAAAGQVQAAVRAIPHG